MAIDPSISLAVQPPKFESPVNMLSQAYALQNAAQQNRLGQMQMAEYERARSEEEGVRNYLRGADLTRPGAEQGLLQYGKTGLAYAKQLQDARAAALKQKTDQLKYAGDMAEQAGRIYNTVKDETSWQAARQKLAALGGDPSTLPETYDPNFVKSELAQAMSVKDQLALVQPKVMKVQRADGSIVFLDENPNSPTFRQEIMPQQATGMTPYQKESLGVQQGQLKVAQGNLGVAQGRLGIAQAEAERAASPEFQQRMAAAKATGEAIAKGDVAAVQQLPKVISRAEEGIRLIDELVGKRDANGKLLKGSKPHPGFETSVGATLLPGARFVPGTDAAGFMARYEQLKGASFLEAFESLKGGGAITEKEGEKATSAINRMNTSTDEKEFIKAAMDLQEVIRKGVQNAQSRAAKTGTVAPAPAAAPATGGVKFLGFE